jgi:hypothetical protein
MLRGSRASAAWTSSRRSATRTTSCSRRPSATCTSNACATSSADARPRPRALPAKKGVRRRDLLEGKTFFLGLDWRVLTRDTPMAAGASKSALRLPGSVRHPLAIKTHASSLDHSDTTTLIHLSYVCPCIFPFIPSRNCSIPFTHSCSVTTPHPLPFFF